MQKPVQIHVEDTNAEAMYAKISAIKKGYFEDEFAEELVKAQGKKDVLIHRGYWLRFRIFKGVIEQFLATHEQCQIISLGCGYDTMPFLMMRRFPQKNFRFFEIDLPIVAKRKIHKIKQSEVLSALCEFHDEAIHSQRYTIFGCDISDVKLLKSKLVEHKIDYSLPTLVFAECVLTYIEPEATQLLLSDLFQSFKQLALLNYEMFNPNDPFGKMMVRNFEYRGCPLVGIDAYPSMQAQHDRLQKIGFKDIQIYDMKTLYTRTPENERKHIEQLEMMDEWEEWNIMQAHYFVALAHNHEFQLKL